MLTPEGAQHHDDVLSLTSSTAFTSSVSSFSLSLRCQLHLPFSSFLLLSSFISFVAFLTVLLAFHVGVSAYIEPYEGRGVALPWPAWRASGGGHFPKAICKGKETALGCVEMWLAPWSYLPSSSIRV